MLQKHSILWKGWKMISNPPASPEAKRWRAGPVLRRLLRVFLPLSAITVLLLIFGSESWAGSLNPSASPAATSYTLGDIYLRLTTNATANEANHLFAPTASPASSLYTLKQIYETIPTINAAKVLSGISYLGIAGTYNAANLSTSTVKQGTAFGVSSTGALTPNDGTATVADLFAGATANLTADWTPDTGTLNLACNVSTFDASGNLVPNAYDGSSGSGSNRWCMTDSGNAATSDIALNKIAWVDGKALTGTLYGDTSAAKVLTTAAYTGTYNAASLSTSTVKQGTSFGVSQTGAYSGYPGTEWTGTPTITKETCDAQNANGWYWFEDGNGDGDAIDPEDGVCVKTTAGTAGSWNGDFCATKRDNSYIAAYTCSGSFPSGTVGNYSGIDAACAADTTFDNGDCALCQADCYDGQKDLPGQGGYTTPSEAITGVGGPITPEILKNWKGTRLPTSNDFFGFCGATSGDADGTAGDSAYHSSGASSSKTIGNYGGNAGRGANAAPNDEYMDLSNSPLWEWLSEQLIYSHARVAGHYACSNFDIDYVYGSYRFRAVFRP
ncbi:MAG: hypothetical protein WC650_04330 [Candidatus Doudnabacteria bacterium]